MTDIWGDDDDYSIGSDMTLNTLGGLSNASSYDEEDAESSDREWSGQPDADYLEGLADSPSIRRARCAVADSNPSSGLVHLGYHSCPHSRYLTDLSDYHATGYVGNQVYVLPLHRLPVVAGHTTLRVAVRCTDTTRRSMKVLVTCNAEENPVTGSRGSPALSQLIKYVVKKMDANEFVPFTPQVTEYTGTDINPNHCPLSLGCRVSVEILSQISLTTHTNEGAYHVPNGCDTKNYRRPCGLGSTLAANNVVVMYPNVLQYLVSSDMRQSDPTHTGFLCCSSSPSSASSKGMIRYLASGVVMRSYKSGVRDQMISLSINMESLACTCIGGDNPVSLCGVTTLLCDSCYKTLLTSCRMESMKTPHCITLHEKTNHTTGVTISICNGAVMRRDDPNDGRWIDSESRHSSIDGYHQLLSEFANIIPFPEYINPVRAGLISTYLQQAVCRPSCRYDSTRSIAPVYSVPPLMVPMDVAAVDADLYSQVPGMNLFTIFCNMDLTYEDGMVMSRSTADKFKYICRKKVKLWDMSMVPAMNSKVPPFSRPWWQVAFEGTIVGAMRCESGSIAVYVEFLGLPVNGDKFTTLHGQKGVVTILPDEKMPMVQNRHAELVIGSSVIIKRGTASQLIEAACGMYCVDRKIEPCRYNTDELITMYRDDYRLSSRVDAIDHICTRYEGDVYMMDQSGTPRILNRRTWQLRSSISSTAPVRANYGYIRVMQSVFMASTSMSCTQVRSGNRQKAPMSVASRGGSIGLGEMELQQLEASGMKNCLNEFSIRSDLCKIDVCSKCKCIMITCSCELQEGEPTNKYTALLPLSSIKTIIATRVSSSVNVELTPYVD